MLEGDYTIDILFIAEVSSSAENLDLSEMDLNVLIFATLGLIVSYANGMNFYTDGPFNFFDSS